MHGWSLVVNLLACMWVGVLWVWVCGVWVWVWLCALLDMRFASPLLCVLLPAALLKMFGGLRGLGLGFSVAWGFDLVG